ncbi:hypothetical protein [Endozoicomonas sp.]|uniref:hypothetical protein n=1 Tax=Endozoicomonas sp. TaxID=1892382 RepID=UPI003839EB77
MAGSASAIPASAIGQLLGKLSVGIDDSVEASRKNTAFGNSVEAQESSLLLEDREIFRDKRKEPGQTDNKDRKITAVSQEEKNGVDADKKENIDDLKDEVDGLMHDIIIEAENQFPTPAGQEFSFEECLNKITEGYENVIINYDSFEASMEELNEASGDLSESILEKMYLFITDPQVPNAPEDLFRANGLGLSTYSAQPDSFSGESVTPSKAHVECMFRDFDSILGSYGRVADVNNGIFLPSPFPQPDFPQRNEQVQGYASCNGDIDSRAMPEKAMNHSLSSMPVQSDNESKGIAKAGITRPQQTVEPPADNDNRGSVGNSGNVTSTTNVNSEEQLSEPVQLEGIKKQEENNSLERSKKCLFMLAVFSKLLKGFPDWLKGKDRSKDNLKSKFSEIFDKGMPADGSSEVEQLEALKNKKEKLKVVRSLLVELSSANDWMNKIKLFVDKKDAIKGIIKEFGEKSNNDLDSLIFRMKERNKETIKVV